jgi:hypothetical protein
MSECSAQISLFVILAFLMEHRNICYNQMLQLITEKYTIHMKQFKIQEYKNKNSMGKKHNARWRRTYPG